MIVLMGMHTARSIYVMEQSISTNMQAIHQLTTLVEAGMSIPNSVVQPSYKPSRFDSKVERVLLSNTKMPVHNVKINSLQDRLTRLTLVVWKYA